MKCSPPQVVAVPLTKYVDVNAFVRLLPGLPSALRVMIAVGIGVIGLWFLLPTWWRLEDNDAVHRRLVWAATVTWTLVLNVYVGIYDVTLAVFAAFLAADIWWPPGGLLPRDLRVLLVLLYLVPWISQPLANATGVQTMTVVLLGMGIYLARHFPTNFRSPEWLAPANRAANQACQFPITAYRTAFRPPFRAP